MDFGREWIGAPQGGIAGRHHVAVPRETEIRRAGADPRLEIVDRCRARRLEAQPRAIESERRERGLKHAERARIFRRDRRTADERLRQRDRVKHKTSGLGVPTERGQPKKFRLDACGGKPACP